MQDWCCHRDHESCGRVRVYVEKSWEVLLKDKKVKLQLLWRPQYSIQTSILGHSPKSAAAIKWSSLCLRVKLWVTAVGVRGLKLLKSFEVQKIGLWVPDVEQTHVFHYLAFSFFWRILGLLWCDYPFINTLTLSFGSKNFHFIPLYVESVYFLFYRIT